MSVIINNQQFPAEYLSTPEEMAKGMMDRDKLDGCVVFKTGLGHHSFWMRNCRIPLDIVFILKNRINRIHQNCPVPDSHQLTLPRYTGIGDHVIEFPAGTASKWKVGDRVIMYLGTPQNPAF